MSKLQPDAQVLAAARARLPLVQRYTMQIRYARDMGWLEVRDPFSGEWLTIWGKDAPSSWRRQAYAEKLARRRVQEQRPNVRRETADEEVAF
jgi:hypothetical protein